MEYLVRFLASVTAGVVSHLVCKWIDQYGKGQ